MAGTGVWILKNTAPFIYKKILESSYNKVTRKVDEKKLDSILEDYNARFEKQLDMVSKDAELVLEGLEEYTEKELISGFMASLLLERHSYRKEAQRKLLEGAYVAANAMKPKQKKMVEKYVTTVYAFLDEFTMRKLSLEVAVQKNLLEDSLREYIEQVNSELRTEIEEIGRMLVDRNSFASMIDQIQSKESLDNTFHYLNKDIGFWGREAEIQILDDFLEDARPVLYTAVTAPGGCGKSKLVYEFVKKHRYSLEWEMQYLEGTHVDKLTDYKDYCYPRNLLLIVDYAGVYAEKLGIWMNHLLRLRETARPKKIRVILLERESGINYGGEIFEPTWKKSLEGSGEQKNRLKNIFFQKQPFGKFGDLSPLSDCAIRKLLCHRMESSGILDVDDLADKFLERMKCLGGNRIANARPLIALLMTQSYIEGQDVFRWNPQDMIEYFIERQDKQYRYLSGDREDIVEAVQKLVFHATVTGEINLDDENDYLKKEIELLEEISEESYVALLSGINQNQVFRNVIMPMEPDILGEYYVLRRLLQVTLRQKKFKELMAELWKRPDKCFAFLSRCILDYGERRDFYEFFMAQIDVLLPEANSKVKAEMKSKLLHLMLVTIPGKRTQLALFERMQLLYEANPKYEKIAEDYAAFLMLEYKNHFGDYTKQDKNVELINKLRKKFPASTYLDTIYGKSLYNQVVTYTGILKMQDTPGRVKGCKANIDANVKKLEILCTERPENMQVRRSYQMAMTHVVRLVRV